MITKHKYWLFLVLLSVATLIYSCANQGNLSGGERDEEPPALLSVYPPNGTLNSYPSEIEFVFNENIDLEDINNNLLVSPVLENKPEVKQKSQSFTILIADTLLENTTYTFNFGNSITDLNEGNEIKGFTYVFSTGPEIDKGRLSGSVIDATTGNLPDDVESLWAILYSADSFTDTTLQTTTPNYVSPIQEDGSFLFQNIAEKTYHLYILRDNNFNYYYDLPNEAIAFRDSTIVVDSNEQVLAESLPYFVEEDTIGKVLKVNRHKNSFSLETNLSGRQLLFRDSLDQIENYPVDFFDDSVRFWLPPDIPENELYVFQDTLAIDTIQTNAFSGEDLDSSLSVKMVNATNFSFQKQLFVQASKPFADSINNERITLLEDSLFVAGGVFLKRDSVQTNRLLIDQKWQFGKEYSLTFDDSTFQSVYGQYSDSLSVTFQAPAKSDLGGINIQLDSTLNFNQLIVQLYQGDDLMEERVTDNYEPLLFDNLSSGNYQIQVIVDENKNGEWDTGSFLSKRQPEQIIRYDQDIRVTSSWTIDVPITSFSP